ncbi:MAG TPA: FAD-dependent oxidoreductase [Bacillaceae bacterium]
MDNEQKLSKDPQSYWMESTKRPVFSELQEDLSVDVAIVGGGITGVTAAYLLVKEGFRVAVLEASSLLGGTTGHTTAKITAQHGLFYDQLIQKLGEEKARLYYQANKEAGEFVEQVIKLHGIECDFRKEDAYVYTNSADYLKDLDKEAKAYETLGIDGGFVEDIPLQIANKGAVVMKNQAQFHPLKYLTFLVEYIQENGALIYENTVVNGMDEGDTMTVKTKNGSNVQAKYVIAASHFPFHDDKGFFARMEPERSYVIAIKSEKPFPGGMYINAEKPTRSVRSANMDGEEILLVSGDHHKTGQGKPEMERYQALEQYAQQQFASHKILYRWSAQDYSTLDKVPYIGRIGKNQPNLFVGTGYRKWGMTHSNVAALLFTDLILGRENPYEALFTPSRFDAPQASIQKAIKMNANVAAQLVSGKLESPDKELKDIKPGEGAAVSIKGARAGAYRNEQGELFVVDTTCTHMGCEVNWNSGDRTWDCPCHGSRFTYEGDIVEGPAKTPLKKIDPDNIDYTTSK